MNYKDLGAISKIETDYNDFDKNEISEIILSHNSGKKLYITYTHSCCEHSWFEYYDSSLMFDTDYPYDDDFENIFIGRTIDTIDHVENIGDSDNDNSDNSDNDNSDNSDSDNSDNYNNYKIGHIYKITFTDNISVSLVLYCVSNGYYDSSLETKIE